MRASPAALTRGAAVDGRRSRSLCPQHRLRARRRPAMASSRVGTRTRPGRGSALVLVPTRELASRSRRVEPLRWGTKAESLAVYGGAPIGRQIEEARTAPHPRRDARPALRPDRAPAVTLDGVRVLVLDEADRMLDMGFKPQVDRILRSVPDEPADDALLAPRSTAPSPSSPARYTVNAVAGPRRAAAPRRSAARSTTPSCPSRPRTSSTASSSTSGVDRGLALVFVRTKHGADKLARKLERQHNIAAVAMHGNLSQNQRERALAQFEIGPRLDARRDGRRRPRPRRRRHHARDQLRPAAGRRRLRPPRRPHRPRRPQRHRRDVRAAGAARRRRPARAAPRPRRRSSRPRACAAGARTRARTGTSTRRRPRAGATQSTPGSVPAWATRSLCRKRRSQAEAAAESEEAAADRCRFDRAAREGPRPRSARPPRSRGTSGKPRRSRSRRAALQAVARTPARREARSGLRRPRSGRTRRAPPPMPRRRRAQRRTTTSAGTGAARTRRRVDRRRRSAHATSAVHILRCARRTASLRRAASDTPSIPATNATCADSTIARPASDTTAHVCRRDRASRRPATTHVSRPRA